MLFRAKPVATATKLRAFSLLEILVALALGSGLLLAAAHLYRDIYLAHQRYHEQMRLQQHTHQLLDYLRQHLLNAGYQGLSRTDSNFALFQQGRKPYLLEPHCLILLQDLNRDGCLGTRVGKRCQRDGVSIVKEFGAEIIAFNADNQLLSVLGKNEKFTGCQAANCQRLLSGCSRLQWDKLSNTPDHRLERFELQWIVPDELMQIRLALSSLKQPDVRYEASAYAYLLNGKTQ